MAKFIYWIKSNPENDNLGVYTNKKLVWEESLKIIGVGSLESGSGFAHNYVKLCRLFRTNKTVYIGNLTTQRMISVEKVELNE